MPTISLHVPDDWKYQAQFNELAANFHGKPGRCLRAIVESKLSGELDFIAPKCHKITISLPSDEVAFAKGKADADHRGNFSAYILSLISKDREGKSSELSSDMIEEPSNAERATFSADPAIMRAAQACAKAKGQKFSTFIAGLLEREFATPRPTPESLDGADRIKTTVNLDAQVYSTSKNRADGMGITFGELVELSLKRDNSEKMAILRTEGKIIYAPFDAAQATLEPKPKPTESLVYTATEACEALKIAPTTLWRLEKRGLLKPIPHTRHKLYSVESVKRFAESDKT